MTFTINDWLVASGSSAIALLEPLLPAAELEALGAEPGLVGSMHALRHVYFGPTKSTRRQRQARENAASNKLGFDRLGAIERVVRRLHDSSKDWALRLELTRFVGNHRDFRRHAREKLAAYNAAGAKPESKPSLKITHHKGTTEATLSLRAASSSIREIEAFARKHAADNGISVPDAAIAAFLKPSQSAPVYRIKVLVTLENIRRILSGEGSDVLVQTTSGAIMTGTELMSKQLDPVAEFIGLTPMHGAISIATGNTPINNRTKLKAEQARRARDGIAPVTPAAVDKALSRHGSYKDRCLQEANQTLCAGEDCSVPVAYCELNHNVPFSKGGLSLLSNLSLLCRYHNGRAGMHERYTNIRGAPHQILPGGALIRNEHPLSRYSSVVPRSS
ncbi:hypothetical protein QP027_08325 [Corynebacterium breve]|uniref:HNH endonuclease n=1 Tax=Corynebacterium breve TaxID=3049799 RepID=A0ABY8VDD6_9CORY|nr:hypothetical protein [Corynebacterium breve]WIM67127.1 hypothetical protein QP027_08325 [Corynebacterium breve]